MRIERGELNFFGNQLYARRAGAAVVVVPDLPGLEFVAPNNKLHYKAESSKLHFKADDNKLHYRR